MIFGLNKNTIEYNDIFARKQNNILIVDSTLVKDLHNINS